METYGDTRSDAIKNIRRSDEARASYYEKISGQAWGDRRNYDLIVNSGMGIEECAEVVYRHVVKMQTGGVIGGDNSALKET